MTATAFRRLAAHPGVPRIVRGDPRFARVLDEPTRRALIAAHDGRPPTRDLDYRAALPAAAAAVQLLDRIAVQLLEDQVTGLIRSLLPPGSQQLQRVLEVTGWAGGRPVPTAAVAAAHGVGRASVGLTRRQVRAQLPARPWLPALDAAGEVLHALAPAPPDQAARDLRDAQITDRLYDPVALLDLADRLRLDWRLELVAAPDGPLIASRRDAVRIRRDAAAAEQLQASVLAAMRSRRIVHVDELSELPLLAGRPRARRWADLAALQHVVRLPGRWLGSIAPSGSSQFDHTLRAMLAVNPTLPVGAVNDGMRRGMATRQLRWTVPDGVLAAYLQQRDDVQVDGDTIHATQPPDDAQLPALQRALLTALRRSPTGTLRYSEIVSVYAASGGSPAAARVYLARSPLLQRVSPGVYAARGDH